MHPCPDNPRPSFTRSRGASVKHPMVAAATLACCFAAQEPDALAQSAIPGTDYFRFEESVPYEPLRAGAKLAMAPTLYYSGWSTTENLPFPFEFFGEVSNSVLIGAGAVFFEGHGTAYYFTRGFGTSTPNAFIAPYWTYTEYLRQGAGVYVMTEGTAPNRTFTIEFRDAQHGFISPGGSMNSQVRLYEAIPGMFEIQYSSSQSFYGSTSSVYMGIESPDGRTWIPLGASGGCTGTCSFDNLSGQAGQRIRFVPDRGVDVTAASVEAPGFSPLGQPFSLDYTLINLHANETGQITLEVGLSENEDGSDAVHHSSHGPGRQRPFRHQSI